jgi:hypothetical protein
MTHIHLAWLAFPLLTPVLAAQRTWVVHQAGGAGVDFTDIPPCITAAAPGDRIEVRGSFLYSSFYLDKGLDIEATQGASAGEVTVQNVRSNQWARVTGFTVNGSVGIPFGRGTEVVVADCAGPVTLSNLHATLQGGVGIVDGISITRSLQVLLLDCRVDGAGGVAGAFGGRPVVIDQSQVTLQRCSLQAGNGMAATTGFPPMPGTPGRSALSSHASLVFVVDCDLIAGRGGAGGMLVTLCVNPGPGGNAIDGDGEVIMGGSTLTAGNPGAPVGSCPGAAAGFAALGGWRITSDCVLTGALQGGAAIGPPFLHFTAPPVVNRGAVSNFVLSGPPGSVALMLIDATHSFLRIPEVDGYYLLTFNRIVLNALVVGAGGSVVWPVPVPNDASLRNVWVFYQGLGFVPPFTRVHFTSVGDQRIR